MQASKSSISFYDIIFSIGSGKIKFLKLLDFCVGSVLAGILPSRKQVSVNTAIKNILIIRPGGIGDAVFLLPILNALRQQYPQLKIDILCESRNAQVFQSQQEHHRVNVFDYNCCEDLWHILHTPYSLVVDTEQWHYLSAIVSYFVKTPYRVGFATRRWRAGSAVRCRLA